MVGHNGTLVKGNRLRIEYIAWWFGLWKYYYPNFGRILEEDDHNMARDDTKSSQTNLDSLVGGDSSLTLSLWWYRADFKDLIEPVTSTMAEVVSET